MADCLPKRAAEDLVVPRDLECDPATSHQAGSISRPSESRWVYESFNPHNMEVTLSEIACIWSTAPGTSAARPPQEHAARKPCHTARPWAAGTLAALVTFRSSQTKNQTSEGRPLKGTVAPDDMLPPPSGSPAEVHTRWSGDESFQVHCPNS